MGVASPVVSRGRRSPPYCRALLPEMHLAGPSLVPWPPVPTLGLALLSLLPWFPKSLDRDGGLSCDL